LPQYQSHLVEERAVVQCEVAVALELGVEDQAAAVAERRLAAGPRHVLPLRLGEQAITAAGVWVDGFRTPYLGAGPGAVVARLKPLGVRHGVGERRSLVPVQLLDRTRAAAAGGLAGVVLQVGLELGLGDLVLAGTEGVSEHDQVLYLVGKLHGLFRRGAHQEVAGGYHDHRNRRTGTG